RLGENESSLFSIETTLSKCAAFLQVVISETAHKSVSLVHETFKHYIIDGEECKSFFYVDPFEANAWLAMSSILYLEKQCIRHPDEWVSPSTLRDYFDQKHPLFSYAMLYWSTHLLEAKLISERIQSLLIISLRRFFEEYR